MVLKVLSGSNQYGFKSIKDLSEGDFYFLIKLFFPFVSLKPVHEVASGCVLCAAPPRPHLPSLFLGELERGGLRSSWLIPLVSHSGLMIRFSCATSLIC